MQARFDGCSVIVTGAANGIGAAVARLLAGSGAHVTAFDLDREAGEALAASSEAIRFERVDVGDAASVARGLAAAAQWGGPVDGLVNNAGVAPKRTLEGTTAADWERVLRVNLTGAWHCVGAVAPEMKRRRQGAIVNVSSVAGKNISLGAGFSYTTTKWGLIGFSRHLAYELAAWGIRVNLVCPGPTRTAFLDLDEAAQRRSAAGVPLGRLVEPEDVASAIAFLLSPLASMCTGAEIVVDGGVLLGSGAGYDAYFDRLGEAPPERD